MFKRFSAFYDDVLTGTRGNTKSAVVYSQGSARETDKYIAGQAYISWISIGWLFVLAREINNDQAWNAEGRNSPEIVLRLAKRSISSLINTTDAADE